MWSLILISHHALALPVIPANHVTAYRTPRLDGCFCSPLVGVVHHQLVRTQCSRWIPGRRLQVAQLANVVLRLKKTNIRYYIVFVHMPVNTMQTWYGSWENIITGYIHLLSEDLLFRKMRLDYWDSVAHGYAKCAIAPLWYFYTSMLTLVTCLVPYII